MDKLDFVWVNLDANETPEVPWEEGFGTVDEQPRLQAFNMKNYHFDHQWEMVGDYNWKTLADNYNEVSHWHKDQAKQRQTNLSCNSATIALLATLR